MIHTGAAIGVVKGDMIGAAVIRDISYSDTTVYFHMIQKRPRSTHSFVIEYAPLDNVTYSTERTLPHV